MNLESVGPGVAGPAGSPPKSAPPAKNGRGMHGCLIAFLVVLGTLVLSVGIVGGLALSIPGFLAPDWTPAQITPDPNLAPALQQRLMDQMMSAGQQAMLKGQATTEMTLTQDELNGLLAQMLRSAAGGGGLPVAVEAADAQLTPDRLGLRMIVRLPLGPVPLMSGRRIGISVQASPSMVGNSLQVKLEQVKLGRFSIPVDTVMNMVQDQLPPTGTVVLVPGQAVLAYSMKPTRVGDAPVEASLQSVKVEEGRLRVTLLLTRLKK